MANDHECRHKKKSSSVGETSMLLVANIIRLSSRRLFGGHSFRSPQPQIRERTQARYHHVPKLSKSQTAQKAESSIITKPRSYVMKQEQVGQSLMRHDINDVDANAESYISQVREKIRANNDAIAATATSGVAVGSSSAVVIAK